MADYSESDMLGYLTALATGPPKRKRGRPRKNPLPADDAASKAEVVRAIDFQPPGIVWVDEGELAFDYQRYRPVPAVKAAAGLEGVEGPAEGPVEKRKRGRLRKEQAPETGVRAGPTGLLALEPLEGTGIVGRAVAPVKRGPGWPRKNPSPVVEAPITPIAGAVSGLTGTGLVVEPVVDPFKRKRGRPRKHPVPEPGAPGSVVQLNGTGIPVPITGLGGNGTGLVDRYGIGPGNKDGIGFWPPRPEEMEAVKTGAVAAGVVPGRKRGRKRKDGPAPV